MKKEPLYTGAFFGVLDKQKQVIAGFQKDYKTDLNNFKKELQKGELLLTPFDQIRAFTTVLLEQWDDKTTKPFKDLQEKVEKNQGNEVLVIKSTTSENEMMKHYLGLQDSSGMMPEPRFYTTKFDLKLGKVSSPLELNLQTKDFGSTEVPFGEIVIPVLKTLSANFSYPDYGVNPMFSKDLGWSVTEGPIKEELIDLPHLLPERYKNLGYYVLSDSGPEKQSKILFDKEIKEYFAKCVGGEEFYQKVQGTLKSHEQNKVTGL